VQVAPSNRLRELDALRGIAVMLVVLVHFTLENDQAKPIFKLGVTGVDLFFMISGFVILLTLEKTKNWQDFIVSRFSRIYPAYWASVSLTAVATILMNVLNNQSWVDLPIKYLANMTMFQNYFKIDDLDEAYWTLQVEVLFYLFMMIVFVSKKLKKIEIISCFALIPVIGYHLLLNTKFHVLHMRLENYLSLLGHFPLFFAGILFYKMKFEQVTRTRYVLMILCLIIQYILFFDSGTGHYRISQLEYGSMLIIYFTLFVLYVKDKLNFVVNPLTLFLGDISYNLYLLNNFLGVEFITPLLVKYAKLNFWVASFGVALPVILVVAILTNRYVEKPAMNYIRLKYKRRSGGLSLDK
jgi:peptidoglycan/LPS O-acetylase OafA/YrhL